MEQFKLENLRNAVLLGHNGAGKTSVSESILFTTGTISRLGKVDEGNTTSDYDPDEIKRRISINLSVLPCQWQGNKINFLDTPGYMDLVAEVKAGMRVSDGAVIVVCAVSGCEVGTERVWNYCNDANLPRLIFINKMDRENADFTRTLGGIRAKFGNRCVPLQLPIGDHTTFKGLVDLLTMKAYSGSPAREMEIPADVKKEAESLREKLVESVAEVDDKLIEKYLGGEEISLDELRTTLKRATLAGNIVPVLAGSGLQNVGMGQLLDAVIEYLPSAKASQVVNESGTTIELSQEGPLAALVFKTAADPYVGKLTYFRVYTGHIDSTSQVWNANKGANERIGQLYMLRGKNQEPVPGVKGGDIGAVAKLNVTTTGDTLCNQNNPIKLPGIVFPEPIFGESVHPKTKADVDKMGAALQRLVEEDPTLRVKRQPDTAETVLYGLGETHLDVAAERMQRKFGVGVTLETPRVPYKETITVPTKAEHKHKKQSGGHGQYGHVLIELEPKARGTGNEFAEHVVGGTVPRNFIPAVEKGVNEGFQEGPLGFPIVDTRVTLYDGSYHAVDSSEICFKIAGAQALKKGMESGQPILLEPIVKLKVTVPSDQTGDIISDLNTKRARVHGMIPEGDMNVIEAEAPLSEVQRYSIDLKSMTQGRATYTAEFSRFEAVPAHIIQKIIAARQAEKAAAKEV